MRKLPFSTVWNKYKTSSHPCSMNLPNQCAIRMSRALIDAGWSADAFRSAGYSGKLCPHGYTRGAQDLAAFLQKAWGFPDMGWNAPGSAPKGVSGQQGLVCFMGIPGFDGQGHIDLWDGSDTQTGDYWDSDTIWFWRLP